MRVNDQPNRRVIAAWFPRGALRRLSAANRVIGGGQRADWKLAGFETGSNNMIWAVDSPSARGHLKLMAQNAVVYGVALGVASFPPVEDLDVDRVLDRAPASTSEFAQSGEFPPAAPTVADRFNVAAATREQMHKALASVPAAVARLIIRVVGRSNDAEKIASFRREEVIAVVEDYLADAQAS